MPTNLSASLEFLWISLLVVSSATAFGCAPPDDAVDANEAASLSFLEPASQPKIAGIRLSGAGCPDPTEVHVSEGRDSFSAELGSYVVVAASNAPSGKADCKVTALLDAQDGVAYAPAGLDVALSTDSSSQVTLTTTGLWTSVPENIAETQTRISTRGWRTTQTVLDEEELWSSCEGPRELHLGTELSLTAATGRSGYAAIHQLSNLRFRTRRCTPPNVDESVPSADAGAVPQLDGAVDAASADASISAVDLTSSFQITKVTLLGHGCLPENTTVAMAPDRRTFDLETRQFVGRTTSTEPAFTHCGFFIDVAAPRGYRTVLESFDVEGEQQIDSGATALILSRYWLSPRAASAKEKNLRIRGPQSGGFTARVDFGSSGFDYDFCQPNLTASLDIQSDGPAGGPGMMVDIRRVHSWKFRLERCR